jgi:CDGSH-type Zn-finger protein
VETNKADSPDPSRFKVKVVKDGPYLVTGGVPLSEQSISVDSDGECHGWEAGQEYPVQEKYALCRCGCSTNTPYCDGTHESIEFDGTETAADIPFAEQAKVYDGPGLRLMDAEAFCVGAGFCRRAGSTWNLARDSADPHARHTAIEESCDCPSGRLVACDKDGRPLEPDLEPSISLVEDKRAGKMGPIWVKGRIEVESSEGHVYEARNRVTLCRCGRSCNKPFCDGSHLKGPE